MESGKEQEKQNAQVESPKAESEESPKVLSASGMPVDRVIRCEVFKELAENLPKGAKLLSVTFPSGRVLKFEQNESPKSESEER